MSFDEYYARQSGRGVYTGKLWQKGGSIRGFAGREFQYGNGLGSFGRTLFRWAKPLLKYLGKQGLQAGVNIGSDILAGNDIKDAIKTRAKETGAAIAEDAATVVKKKLSGRGRKMARRRRRAPKRTHKKKAPLRRR